MTQTLVFKMNRYSIPNKIIGNNPPLQTLEAFLFPNVSLNGNSASLGPTFDGSCANNGTKTKIGRFGLWKVPHRRKSKWLNVPLFVFVVLFSQKPSKLGPNGPHIG